jgi:hypothetical protein
MSVIQSQKISLTEVIEDSNIIIEVGWIKSYSEEITISLKGSTIASKAFPPFIKKGNVFLVRNILKNTSGVKLPESINVPDENWRRSLGQHKEKYLKGTGKSYTVKEYPTNVKRISGAALLFLHHFQDMYELTARDSFDDKTVIEKVVIIMQGA